jgi:hypothetical protein
MRVDVTQYEIDNARPFFSCPIALALLRITGVRHVVGRETAAVNNGDTNTVYELPLEARDFIARFDARGKVQPFVFEMSEVPVAMYGYYDG